MTDDLDEPERERRQCRVCSGEDLLPDEQHACLYANSPQMSAADEAALIALLESAPLDTWHPSSPWATDEHKLGDWTFAVFFDGVDANDLDYLESAVSPDGTRYVAWPQHGEPALPMSIANWVPRQMGPAECVERAMSRAFDRLAALVSARP